MNTNFLKNPFIHDRLALKMNRCLQDTAISEWKTKEKSTLIQNHPNATALNNYRPITCLPMTWKILKAQIREDIYSLLSCRLFHKEQKGFHKKTSGTEYFLYIDQWTLEDRNNKKEDNLPNCLFCNFVKPHNKTKRKRNKR